MSERLRATEAFFCFPLALFPLGYIGAMTDRSRHGSLDTARHGAAGRMPSPSVVPVQNEAIRIVCVALGLACVVLAIRIASIW